jgi:hypothetical protein
MLPLGVAVILVVGVEGVVVGLLRHGLRVLLAIMLPHGFEAILVLGVKVVVVALLRLGLRVLLADLTHVHAEVPARTALNSLTEVREV